MSLDLTGALTDKYYAEYRDYFVSTEKIGYYVHDIVSLIDEPSNTYSWSHWDGHEVIIEKAFAEVDRYIDLDFHRTIDASSAEIHIYRVSPYPGIPDNTLGFAIGSREGSLIPSRSNNMLFQSVVWTDFKDEYKTYYSSNPFLVNEGGYDFGTAKWQDAHTIIHEIGHALGLSHPQSHGFDDPWGGEHNSSETIMSYNADIKYDSFGIFAKAPSWSDEDISTLQLIWGVENGNNNHPTEGSDSLKGTFARDGVYLFGGDDIFHANAGDDFVMAGFGADQVFGEEGIDFLHGNHGRDYLDGGNGDDTIRGGHGPDQIFGGNGSDWIWGGIGRNTVDAGVRDNAKDDIFVPVDSIQNAKYGNPGGANFDPLLNLGLEDKIYLHGRDIRDASLAFGETSFDGYNGIGIYANGTLEALVTGGFTTDQVSNMTTGGFFA